VLTWLSLLAGVSAVVVTVRWAGARTDALGRTRGFPSVAVGLLVVLMAVCGVPVLRHHLLESRLEKALSALVGQRVGVRCQTLSQTWLDAHTELGYVRVDAQGVPESRTVISKEACDHAASWLSAQRAKPTTEQAIGVHVLTHEAMHMAGTLDEARAECAAVQRDARLAVLLGADRAQAGRLARTYWLVEYNRLPEPYRSAECGPGRSLDEHLEDPPWSQ
jgi:hypothetical protein